MKSRNRIEWCKKQRRGLRIVPPSDHVCRAYLAKAESALNMLESAIEKDEPDWIIATAYYAKYLSLYAFFAKIGVTSQIHDCTIEAAGLLVKAGLIKPELHKDNEEAKDLRIEMQYYIRHSYDRGVLEQQAGSAPGFVLKMRELSGRTDEETTDKIRAMIERGTTFNGSVPLSGRRA